MKGRIVVAILDGKADSKGEVLLKSGVTLPESFEVPVLLEFRRDLTGMVGKAKLSLEGDILYADVELLDTLLPTPSEHVLYPAVGGVVTERDDRVLKKWTVREVGLSISKNDDERIGTLHAQGVRKKRAS